MCNLVRNWRASWFPVIKCNDHRRYIDYVQETVELLPHIFNQGYDIVAPKPYHFFKNTVYEYFDEVVNRGLMGFLRQILRSNTNYYYEFEESLKDTDMYYANISVMKEDLFDEYCEFVFGVFDELEYRLINENYYIDLYKEKSMYRIFGYIGELLTNVYIRKKKKEGYKIKELCLLYDSSAKGNESIDYKKIRL